MPEIRRITNDHDNNTGLTTAVLIVLFPGSIISDSLPDVLSWLDARFSLEVLLKEIEHRTTRISELVKA